MSLFLTVDKLSFTYNTAVEPLFSNTSFQIESGWSGIVGANGSGKTTLLQLVCGILTPDSGAITPQLHSIYCEQRTDALPDYSHLPEHILYKNLAKFVCDPHWLQRWQTLSHGERKRCQLAIALAQQPDVLAIDEPTNHLDWQTKQLVLQALLEFSGIGLIVSHDREMLDTLTSSTLFLQNADVRVFNCSYSTAAVEIEREIQLQNSEFAHHQHEIKKLKKRVTAQRQKADTANKRRSKRGIAKKDHDAKAKLDMVRVSGSDGTDGRLHQRFKAKLERAEQQKNNLHFTKEYTLGITFDTTAQRRWFPISIQPHDLLLGEDKHLHVADLSIQHDQKIGLMGENGAGKSSFIHWLLENVNIPKREIVYLPQEIDRVEAAALLARIHHLDAELKGQLLAIIRRLGSDPKHLLTTEIPSPGETRKLLLAEGILSQPAIIIMDEPTNHMDLPSIESLESALRECNCSQLLVSHDQTFLQNITDTLWRFEKNDDTHYSIQATQF